MLQPDSGDETAALLRVLIYKIDNTTFGNDVPTLPQWNGPPRAMVDVQTTLFASLALSLLSALLAMLGKQWLNRYDSTDKRGSAIERSQNRQRKLDGIVTWYFDPVMEWLPLMLQIALLLLGCALSRYLWEISTTIASVVLGVTSFGALIYVFIVVAGTVFEDCPYQTPASRVFRHVGPKLYSTIPSALCSTIRNVTKESEIVCFISGTAQEYHPWWSRGNILNFLASLVLGIPVAFVVDAYLLAHNLLRSMRSFLNQSPAQQPTTEDLRCISWTLQTSLDKPVHLSTLKRLVTMTELTGLGPSLVADCFNIFIGCLGFNDDKVVIVQGSEELATVSATCFFRTFHGLTAADPTSGVLADIRRQYDRIFPFETDFRGLPFFYTIVDIHASIGKNWNPHNFEWDNYRPSRKELIPFARHMAEATRVQHQQMQNRKGPDPTLRFAFHCLASPSPLSVIVDCLAIIAINLGCDLSDFTTLDERYAPKFYESSPF